MILEIEVENESVKIEINYFNSEVEIIKVFSDKYDVEFIEEFFMDEIYDTLEMMKQEDEYYNEVFEYEWNER